MSNQNLHDKANDKTNEMFAEAAKKVISGVMSNLDLKTIMKLLDIIKVSSEDRVFQMWMADKALEETVKKLAANDVIPIPYPVTWTGEAKDLAAYNGNDLQQEAINKLYAVAERVKLCSDKRLKRDWLMLQDVSHLVYMNHQTGNHASFESSYDAFTNYMNVLADFLQMVEEQYPSTIENEELNELLKTINNQEKEIAELEAKLKRKKA